MANKGCGCCGLLSGLGCLLLLLLLSCLAVAFFAVFRLQSAPAYFDRTPPSPGEAGVRFKVAQFLNGSGPPVLALSAAEVNALLEQSPELRSLHQVAWINLRGNLMDCRFTAPFHLPLEAERILSYTITVRPVIHDGHLEVHLGGSERDRSGPAAIARTDSLNLTDWLLNEALAPVKRWNGLSAVREGWVANSQLYLRR